MNNNLEKSWPIGVLVATAGCPACFPAIAGVASAMWLTFLQWYEWIALKLVQIFIVLSMILAYFTYKRNKFKATLIMTEISWIIMLISFFTGYITIYYIFLIPLIIASIWNYIIDKKIPNCKDWKCNTNNK